MADLTGITIHRQVEGVDEISFCLAFVAEQQQIDEITSLVARKAPGDAVIWFAYPKGRSKRYVSEISGDAGWDALGCAGFEAVRQVSIDEDWSALRFRRVETIKSMSRDPMRAMTKEGKTRVQE